MIGGTGTDTLIAQGFAFTSGQRAAIFAQGSVETIQDTSGTYSAPVAITSIEGVDNLINAAEAAGGIAVSGFAKTGATLTVNGVSVAVDGWDSGPRRWRLRAATGRSTSSQRLSAPPAPPP